MPNPFGDDNILTGFLSKRENEMPVLGQYYNQANNQYTDPFVDAITGFANNKKKKPVIDIDAMINRLANENNVQREEIINALRGDSRLKGDPEGAFGSGELERVRTGSADW